MKIGILTLPQETNYGGILQAFALQNTLRKMGHDAITIDRHPRRGYPSLLVHLASFIARNIKAYLLHKPVSTQWSSYITEDEYKIISHNIQQFIDKNIKMTRRIYSDQLGEIEREYMFDAYVVGSDQVWLDYYCPNSFLDFVTRQEVKRITYAASSGKQSFFNDESKIRACKKLAQLFSGISVREQELVNKCKELLDIEAKLVLDPTMLLNVEDYLNAVSPATNQESIVFSYILDRNEMKNKLIQEIANHYALPIIDGNIQNAYKKDGKMQIEDCIYSSVDDWINNMYRSKFVVTDSFHGTVFSILFNKPFLTIGNVKRGIARFQSLLKTFNLDDRLVTIDSSFDIYSIMKKDIDYDKVNEILELKRKESLSFIKSSLYGNQISEIQ